MLSSGWKEQGWTASVDAISASSFTARSVCSSSGCVGRQGGGEGMGASCEVGEEG